MKKLLLILSREYRLRLRRPSFWVLTLLVPLLLAALYAMPVVVASGEKEQAEVLVVDETGLFENGLRPTPEVSFRRMPSLDYARRTMDTSDRVAAILFIPMREFTIPRDAFFYHRSSTPPLALQSLVDSQLQMLLRNAIIEGVYHLEPSVYHSVESTNIRLHPHDAVTESFARVKSVLAVVLAALMVLALIVFGVQVMRSVREEKNSRVVEVVIASIRPLQLLVGKVVAVSLAALTQLALWVVLTSLAVSLVRSSSPELFAYAEQQLEAPSVASKGTEATLQYAAPLSLPDVDLPTVAALFALFFLLGLLLYGALLAALASRLDPDADTLQWTLVAASPMLLVLVLSPWLLQQPAGTLAQCFTLIPFTAPAAAMLRLPFGIGTLQLALAVLLLLASFFLAALLAARTYRRHLL